MRFKNGLQYNENDHDINSKIYKIANQHKFESGLLDKMTEIRLLSSKIRIL